MNRFLYLILVIFGQFYAGCGCSKPITHNTSIARVQDQLFDEDDFNRNKAFLLEKYSAFSENSGFLCFLDSLDHSLGFNDLENLVIAYIVLQHDNSSEKEASEKKDMDSSLLKHYVVSEKVYLEDRNARVRQWVRNLPNWAEIEAIAEEEETSSVWDD